MHIFNDIEREIEEHDVVYSFSEMITICVHSYLLLEINVALERDDTILHFFEIIDDYCKRRDIMQKEKPYAEYKKRVIAAYLTMFVAGKPLWHESKTIPVSTGRNKRENKSIIDYFKKEDLYQATRNAFKDKKKT